MSVKQLFPKWTNVLPLAAVVGLLGLAFVLIGGTWYYATPAFWEVGYQPVQPVNYSHQIHANKLGIDCRYCHTDVMKSRTANVPSVSTCMNCHTVVDDKHGYLKLAVSTDGTSPSPHWRNPDLATLREYWAKGAAIPWKRVHKLPDYVNFTHAAHLNAGVSCLSCHGRIDTMPRVHQVKSLSMAFCLSCHRAPDANLVDVRGKVAGDGVAAPIWPTNLALVQKTLAQPGYADLVGKQLAEHLAFSPPENCSACHY